jgi:hypothetical protein
MAWVNVSRREWIAACRAEGAPDGLDGGMEAARRAGGGQTGADKGSRTERTTGRSVRSAEDAKRLYAETAKAVAASVATARSRALAARGYAEDAERAAREARIAETAGGSDVPQVSDRLSAVARDLKAYADRAEAALKAAQTAAESISEKRIAALISTPDGVRSFPSVMRKAKDAAAKAAKDAETAHAAAWKRNGDARRLIREALADG